MSKSKRYFLSRTDGRTDGRTLVVIELSLSFYLLFYRTQVSLGSVLWVLMKLTPRPFADLIDVTLADEDSNSIPTDDVNRAFLGNVAMQVVPPGGQN